MSNFHVGQAVIFNHEEVTILTAPRPDFPNTDERVWVQFKDQRWVYASTLDLRTIPKLVSVDEDFVWCGSLRLTKADAEAYTREYREADHCGNSANRRNARKRVHAYYEALHVPETISAAEQEAQLTVEQRLDRIEQHLKLGRWSEE